jgi:hypothetical protein
VSYDYWNPFSQKERREIIANERDCFHSRAQAAVDLESDGRFAKLTPNKVTSAEPISQVPRQPPNSPWAYADRNVEPPFEVDVSAVEPVLPTSSADQSIGSPGDAGDAPTTSVSSPGVVGAREGAGTATASSQPSRKSFRRF